MDKFEINIGLFGCVSVGKSTFLNAVVGHQYSDTEMKKTTMVPQVYIEKDESEMSTKSIREINREVNETIGKMIEKNHFSIDKCKPLYHRIDKICDLFDTNIIDTNIRINIYDIPGLNDSASKDIYFEWVRQNIKSFDVIIFMTDINQGLNNSDEIEILNLLMSFVIKHNLRMICLMNKCDDIYFDEKENDLVFEEKEQQNIYIQANNLLADIAKSHGIDYDSEYYTPFYPISSENCFIYQALLNNREHNMDKIHINRLCKNECGANQWKRMDSDQKELVFEKILSDLSNTYESKIRDTGYITVKDIIQRTVTTNKSVFMQNKINGNLDDLDNIDAENLQIYIKTVTDHVKILDSVKKFGIDVSYDLFWDKVMSAITKYIHTIKESNTNIKIGNRLINFRDFEILHEIMQIHCMNLLALQEVLKNIIDYPETDIKEKISNVVQKMLFLYQQIIETKLIYPSDYVCPHNIIQYLQTINTYAKEHFDFLCYNFMKMVIADNKNNFTKYPKELNKLLCYAVENLSSKETKESLVSQFLISKQQNLDTWSASEHFEYLIKLKKLLTEHRSRTISLDILMEVVNENISLFLKCKNKYTNNYSTVIGILTDIAENDNESFNDSIIDIERIIINACSKKID